MSSKSSGQRASEFADILTDERVAGMSRAEKDSTIKELESLLVELNEDRNNPYLDNLTRLAFDSAYIPVTKRFIEKLR